MKIEITKEQYLTLIKAVNAGSCVYGILGDDVAEEYKEESNNIDKLREYFLKFAKDFGYEKITEKFKGKLIMNEEFSEILDEAIDDYDDNTFWHELETRLGKRDFERIMTKEEIFEIEKEGGWLPERIHEIYDGWRKEFEKHGIERLEIVKSKN